MTELGLADPSYVTSVQVDATAIAAVLREHGGDAVIPHCPGWDVTGLVRHLGGVHRWATAIVRTGAADTDAHPAPTAAAELVDWFEAGASALVEVLESTAAHQPCWTFGLPPAVAGFWRRRQALETVVHRFDVEHTIGVTTPIPTTLAVAGVSEVVDFLHPRQVSMGRTPPSGFCVEVHAADAARTWIIGSGGPTAMITGSAADLLLMLWKRPHAGLTLTGDDEALAGLAAAALVP